MVVGRISNVPRITANEKGTTPSGIKETSTKIGAKMTKTSHHPRLKSKPMKTMSIVIYKEWKLTTAEFEHDKQEYCVLLKKGRHHNLKPSGVTNITSSNAASTSLQQKDIWSKLL